MSSSLYGIFNASRSLLLNQAAINVINNNIANINTPGYSKQRLELSQSTIVTPESNIPLIAAQSGMGSVIDSISRNRDIYLDSYLRRETTGLTYYNELADNTVLIEDVINELGDTGISGAFNEFYNAAQQLSLSPTDTIARNNFLQKAQDICNRFNLTDDRLSQLRDNLVGDGADPAMLDASKIKLTADDLNIQLNKIADLNQSICMATSQGNTPNSLLDERDKLLDSISEFIPITVTHGQNNLVSISINGVDLIKGNEQLGFFNVSVGDASTPAIIRIQDKTGADIVANANSMITSGKVGAMLEMGGSDPTKLNIYNIMEGMNTLARAFAEEVNTYQRGGQYVDTLASPNTLTPVTVATPPPDPFDIFVEQAGVTQATYADMTAGNIRVNQDIVNNPYLVAAASSTAAPNETGDGKNMLLIAQLRDKKIGALNSSETESYLNSLVGKVGIQAKSVYDNQETQKNIVDQITNRREAATGVNLDEELTDLIRYQRAFEASAKILNSVNEIMQKIIDLVK